jgi:hypothetical protein
VKKQAPPVGRKTTATILMNTMAAAPSAGQQSNNYNRSQKAAELGFQQHLQQQYQLTPHQLAAMLVGIFSFVLTTILEI